MISDNISEVQNQIRNACTSSGRNIDEVKLIAVSKTKTVEEIEAAYTCGIKVFGENYVQEAIQKIPILKKKYPDISFHMIGHLQSNKAKTIFDHIDCIQSIDSFKLAFKLNELAKVNNKYLKVLIQVNTSHEAQKCGVSPEKIEPLLSEISKLDFIRPTGLMTIGSFSENSSIQKREFETLRNCQEKLKNQGYHDLKELSMGMSNDFELAIKEGATIIRIGTNIFGKRA